MEYLYCDIEIEQKYQDLISNIASFASESRTNIFVFKIPKIELKEETYIHEGCFMILSPGCKIALVDGNHDKDKFEDYCEDVSDLIKYLYSKYEYRDELGKFKDWGRPLIRNYSIDDLANLEDFWKSIKATDRQEIKNTNILVALCTGSINDINRVKKDVPTNVLDQVKQKIQLFDTDQTRFIYQELEKKIIRIQGLSGTGKTELLLHKLKELYQKPEKYKIFVTCHNKILARSLASRIPDFFNFMKVQLQIEWNSRLWCTNAWGRADYPNSGLYRYICYFYDIKFYSYYLNNSFDDVCKNAYKQIKQIKEKNKDEFKYALDYIIIDESQDFKEYFFKLCELVTSKKVYVAGDVFQSIFSEHTGHDYQADFFLTRCYRTDSKTLMFAQGLGLGLFEKERLRWLDKEDWEACGYIYDDNKESKIITLKREPFRRFMDIGDDFNSIALLFYDLRYAITDVIINEISKLKKEFPNLTPNDICIIFLDSDQSVYTMADKLECALYDKFDCEVNKAYETKNKKDNTILISNRNNVKGLEFPFVFCISKKLNNNYAYRNSLYTMLTRSFVKSFLILPKLDSGITEGIKIAYKEIMQNNKMSFQIASEEEQKEINLRFNAAKIRKPLVMFVADILKKEGVSSDRTSRILSMVPTLGWEGLSDDEITDKIHSLLGIIV